MVALLDKSEGVAVHDILISIATEYPQVGVALMKLIPYAYCRPCATHSKSVLVVYSSAQPMMLPEQTSKLLIS